MLEEYFLCSRMKKSAFTLIELLVVIVIIGILATISVAQFNDYQERARLAKAQAFAKQAETLLKVKATSESLLPLLDLTFDQANDATDKGGMQNNGTIVNAVWQSGEDCMNGGCFYFNGTDAKITFDADKTNWQGQGSFTLSTWFRTENFDTTSRHIFVHGGNGATVIALRTSTSSLYTALGDHVGGDHSTYLSDGAYKDRWQHALVSYNSDISTLDIYIDGTKTNSEIVSNTITELVPSYINIGALTDATSFHGSIDDTALYPVALEF